MSPHDPSEIVDRIYEAALVPERWPEVLDDLAAVAGGVGTALSSIDQHNPRWVASESLLEFIDRFLKERWADEPTRLRKVLGARHAGFILEEDVYTPEELENDLMITKLLRPLGLGWGTATVFRLPSDDTLIFSIERRYRDGPVPRSAVAALDDLRPHLGRAALMSARLRLERARAAVTALGLLGLPAGVLSRNHRIAAANEGLNALMPRVILDRRERVALADHRADTLLVQALKTNRPDVPLSVPVAAAEGDPPLVVHLVPVRRDARDVFADSSFILVATPVVPSTVADAEVIQALFDLTAAEAKVARRIGEGSTVEAIARAHNVTEGTVRNQVKAVLQKTGVTRQVDLVRLLGGLKLRP